ncbi:UDP-XYL synthase 6, partial [Striga asiatica]
MVIQIIKNQFCFEVEVEDKKGCLQENQEEQWEFLIRAKQKWGDNWVAGGDWNEVLEVDEKRGGRQKSERDLRGFRIGMQDINMTGHRFTWGNNREGEGFIEERIDRFFTSYGWHANHSRASVVNIFRSSSDHHLLLLNNQPDQSSQKKRRFVFDMSGRGDRDSSESFGNPKEWNTNVLVTERIKETKVALLKWSSSFKAECEKRKKQLTTVSYNASWMWRKWMKVRDKHKMGFRVEINNGKNSNIWKIPWIPGTESGIPFRILNIKTLNPDLEDKWCWAFDKNGIFSVSSTYSYLVLQKMREMDVAENNQAN